MDGQTLEGNDTRIIPALLTAVAPHKHMVGEYLAEAQGRGIGLWSGIGIKRYFDFHDIFSLIRNEMNCVTLLDRNGLNRPSNDSLSGLLGILGSELDGSEVYFLHVGVAGRDDLIEGGLETCLGIVADLLEQLADDDHVGEVAELVIGSETGRGDVEHLDIVALYLALDKCGVGEDHSAGHHGLLKAIERRKVHGYENIRVGYYRRANGRIGNDDRARGCASAHLGAVRGQPRDLLILDQALVGDELSGEEDALSAEA